MVDAGPSEDVLRAIVELACRAPSVHNTQPWSWRSTPDGLDLLADPARALDASDPSGRNLVISCGAALHHAQVVAGALGWLAAVTRLPDCPDDPVPHRLASLALTPGPVPTTPLTSCCRCASAAPTAGGSPLGRCPSTAAPPARIAGAWGAHAVPVVDVTDRFRVDRLVERARDHQARDPRVTREQRAWVDHGPTDGIPSMVLPSATPRPRSCPADPVRHGAARRPGRRARDLRRRHRPVRVRRRAGGLAAHRRGAQRPLASRRPRRSVRRPAEPGDRGRGDPDGAAARGARRAGGAASPGPPRLAGAEPQPAPAYEATAGRRCPRPGAWSSSVRVRPRACRRHRTAISLKGPT